jgi:hypothetical protein
MVTRESSPKIPNAQEHKALQNGCLGGPNGENEAQLYVGETTLAGLLEKGWLERLQDGLSGNRKYRTTESGRAALRAPIPPNPSGPRLTMLKPRVATLDTRTLKPPRN